MHKPIFSFFVTLTPTFFIPVLLTGAQLTHTYLPTPANPEVPWFTGPLLAPGSATTEPGHVFMMPSLFLTTITGLYDKKGNVESTPNFYRLNLQFGTSVGINSFIDFAIDPQFFYQFTQGERSLEFGDLPFEFNIELLKESNRGWIPAIRLSLKTIAPTGKYNNLNPKKLETEASGLGSWIPYSTLSIGRLILLPNGHFISPKVAFGILIPTGVSVKNFNTYGGGKGTKGTVYPGNTFWTDIAVEYNFTQQFAFALDIFYEYQNKTRFSGNPGEIAPGIPASIKSSFSKQWSIAPALEYNWSQNIGLIGGVWFSLAGKNTNQFISGVLELSIYL